MISDHGGNSPASAASPISLASILRSKRFWKRQALHPAARVPLFGVVSVLLCSSSGFMIASNEFSQADLLSLLLYASIAAFAWRPHLAAIMATTLCGINAALSGSGGAVLELAITLGLVAATCALGMIVFCGAAVGALATGVALFSTSLTGSGVVGIAGISAISTLAGLTFRVVTARETLLLEERARAVKELEALSRMDQERIADELHDGIAHDLTLVLFHARALPRQQDDAARLVSLKTIEDSAENAIQSVQSMLSMIREARDEALASYPTRYGGGAIATVKSLGIILQNAGIPTQVVVPSDPLEAPTQVEQVISEAAVEAATNILKHAPHSLSARLRICRTSDSVELVAENHTRTRSQPPAGRTGGRGLRRTRQRLSAEGGRCDSGPHGAGWILRATVPVPALTPQRDTSE